MNKIIPILLILIAACHPHHGSNSKSKYKELTNQVKNKVSVKEVFNKDNFVEWTETKAQPFLVEKVWNESKENGCKSCHSGFALSKMKGKKHKRAHWNIVLKHADSKIMNCTTCHNDDEVWRFKVGKSKVHANKSAKTCMQCHFKQANDWELGSHGKRSVGWQTERAIKSCTSCHNPHRPAFGKRVPKLAPYRPENNEERL